MKQSLLYIFLSVAYLGFSQEVGKYFFELKETGIIQVGDSNNIFFDYDLDGDLDLIISGYNKHISDVTSTHTFLYTNDSKGNFTQDKRSIFMGIEYGNIDTGDIDNDQDLDLIITGQELRKDREDGVVVYQNNKGVFKKIKKIKSITGNGYSAHAKFITINNDEYADLLIDRDDTLEYYINDTKGDFKLQGKLKGIDQAFDYGVTPFDMDNDGDDDLLIQGEIEYIKSKTLFFKNDTGVYQSIPNNFKNTYQGTIQAVDIDNDGDQDIFMTNLGNLSKNLEASFFYINENGNFKERASNIPAYNLGTGHSCFVDLDNDGDKDLIIAGYRRKAPKLPEEYLEIVDIYLNTNGQFTLFKENAFPYLDQGSINAADVDGDGDQDILMTGYVGEITKTVLYINKLK